MAEQTDGSPSGTDDEAADAPDERGSAGRTRRDERVREAARRRMGGLRCVLEGLEDRGNRAAVLRSVEAFGLLHVHEVRGEAERGHERGRGIANAGEKWLVVHEHDDADECARQLRADGFALYAAVAPPRSACEQPRGEPDVLSLEQLDFGRRVALVFGNERRGVSAQMRRACDCCFSIAQRGLSESLNVSVAAAISLHWGRVAREASLLRAAGRADGGGDLTAAELAALEEDYKGRSRARRFQRAQRAASGAATQAA